MIRSFVGLIFAGLLAGVFLGERNDRFAVMEYEGVHQRKPDSATPESRPKRPVEGSGRIPPTR